MKSISEQPAHFATTKFDESDLLEKKQSHAALTKEWIDVKAYGEALKLKVADATRKTNFNDKAALDAFGFQRLQLEIVPNKLI